MGIENRYGFAEIKCQVRVQFVRARMNFYDRTRAVNTLGIRAANIAYKIYWCKSYNDLKQILNDMESIMEDFFKIFPKGYHY